MLRALVFSIIAAAIFILAHYFWWAGLVFFVLFVLVVAQKMILVGILLFAEAVLYFRILAQKKRTDGLDIEPDSVQQLESTTRKSIVKMIFEGYLLLITILIAGYFAFGWFS